MAPSHLKSNMRTLKLSPTIQREWHSRCIGDVIPGLTDYRGQATVNVDDITAKEIADDCKHYINPRAIDASPAERAAYKALLKQVI
jgi:hypothetical protein